MSSSHFTSYCHKIQHILPWLYKYHVPYVLDTKSLNMASILHISGWLADLAKTSWQGMWSYLRLWIIVRKQSKMSWGDLVASVCSNNNLKKRSYQGQNYWMNIARFFRWLEYLCILTYFPLKSILIQILTINLMCYVLHFAFLFVVENMTWLSMLG